MHGSVSCHKKNIGPHCPSYPLLTKEGTAHQVWEHSLSGAYQLNNSNCQVFVRRLVDLIGDKDTKVRFPAAFDRVLDRGKSTILVTTIVASVATIWAGAIVGPVDGGTSAYVLGNIALRNAQTLAGHRGDGIRERDAAHENLRQYLVKAGYLS